MLERFITKILRGCCLSLLASTGVYALGSPTMPQAQGQAQAKAQAVQTAQVPKTELSSAEIAYQTQMLALSNAISAKITQIQAIQKQIDAEIYPASLPPLQLQKAQLQKELEVLNLNQQQFIAQKTAADITQLLQQAKP